METQADASPKPAAVTVGYCAVVLPHLDHYQAYFIVDTPSARASALEMGLKAMLAMGPARSFGAVQAVLVEGALTSDENVVAGAGLSLRNTSGSNYFYVVATREAHGTRTELHKLEASSPDEARDLINALPEVRAIQERLLKSVMEQDGKAGLQ